MTEVIVLGTFHYSGRDDIFTESMQNDLDTFVDRLASLHPTKIAVELPVRLQNDLDGFYSKFECTALKLRTSFGSVNVYGQEVDCCSDNEIVQIGFRLAEKLKHSRVYAVDEDVEMSDDLVGKITPHFPIESYLDKLERMTQLANDVVGVYRVINSDDYIAVDDSIYIAMNKVNLGSYEGSQAVTQWYERNLKIFSNLQNICVDGDRVLLIIGSGHLKILKDLVSRDNQMKLISAFD